MADEVVFPKATEVDVMLLLEGTYPFVSGGVSSWVNQIIRGFPEIRFGACFLGSRPEDYGKPRYALADNVVHVETHYMYEKHAPPLVSPKLGDPEAFNNVAELHKIFRKAAESGDKAGLTKAMQGVLPLLDDGQELDEAAFLHGDLAWKYLAHQYAGQCSDPSFVDYFWTVRIMHSPIWMLSRVAQTLIPARCYHTISTGYAGFLGALLKWRTGNPLILSEHGIYTKERKIDLFQSTWIADNRGAFEKDASQISYFRELWIRLFEALGRVCYDASNDIIALYEINRLRQVRDGADSDRTQNIPNGIDLPRMKKVRAQRPDSPPLVLCMLGRVVPIKDVKTFIRSMRTVVNRLPEAEGWIAGPEDEDPAYAQECHQLAESLGLKDKVKFLGFQRIDELLPKVGMLAISSISEALPLVILEGFAAGVPAVSTDVGSCRQLIFGLGPDDEALGGAGDIVGIADPEALGLAAVRLFSDINLWKQAQAAGIARVENYYTQDMMFGKYRALYQKSLAPTAKTTADAPAKPVEKAPAVIDAVATVVAAAAPAAPIVPVAPVAPAVLVEPIVPAVVPVESVTPVAPVAPAVQVESVVPAAAPVVPATPSEPVAPAPIAVVPPLVSVVPPAAPVVVMEKVVAEVVSTPEIIEKTMSVAESDTSKKSCPYAEKYAHPTELLQGEAIESLCDDLDDDEMELFELLSQARMPVEEVAQVKGAVRALLHRLLAEKPSVLVWNVHKNLRAQRKLRSAIEQVLEHTLPTSYDRATFAHKSASVFYLILEYAAKNDSGWRSALARRS